MAIIDDHAAIADELRRIRNTRRTIADSGEPPLIDAQPQHPMRRTAAGELLYRRLILRSRAASPRHTAMGR